MKGQLGPDNGRRPNIRAPSKKVNFTKNITEVLRNIEDKQSWKYDELPPAQLLEKLKLIGLWWIEMSLNAPSSSGLASRFSYERLVRSFGLLWLLDCHFGYWAPRPSACRCCYYPR
jgi:hypothetical protein